jgi:kinesin family protein 12
MNSFYADNNNGSGGGNMMVPAGMSGGGERVRVAMRVRPMMPHETNRADENAITTPDTQHVLLSLKSGTKSFRFNAVLDETKKQSEVFNACGVHELLDSALEGYSATIFAYG